MFNPEDPLVGLIRGRNTDATDPEVAVLLHEWWAQYGPNLQALGTIARDALARLNETDNLNQGLYVFFEAVVVGGKESLSAQVAAALSELDERIRAQTAPETATVEGVRELFAYLMKLGRIEPAA